MAAAPFQRTDLRRPRGAAGEQFAAEHLRASGFEILERNFRTRHGELDLVAADRRALVFCEVKTRVRRDLRQAPRPLEAIGGDKRRRVRLMAAQWLAARAGSGGRPLRPELRFDAIGVSITPGGRLLDLEHVEDAF